MMQSKFFRALLFVAGLGVLMYIGASLFLPSSRRLIFGVDKRSGAVRLVQNHVTFLPPHQFYRLDFEKRGDAAQRDGFVRIESAEQIPVTIAYRLRFGVAGDRLPDARTLVREGWSAWIGRRVAEAVDAVTRQVPIEQLLAPTSRFNQERDPLRRTVAAYLAKSGLKVTDFQIARIEADREALLRNKRAELRRSARGVAGRVAIFAIDGADWELLSELSNDDRIPNIKALIKNGTTASVQTIQPTVSPMLWTTAATGLGADRHGVLDFIDRARNVPVDAVTRRTPALWEIAEPFGRGSVAVNWWAAWPPASPDYAVFDTPAGLMPNAVSPSTLAQRAQQLDVTADSVGYDQMRRFLTISPDDFQKSVSSGDPRDPVNIFRSILAKTWTDHRVGTALYGDRQPLLFMMQFDGTDAVNHLFAPYHPPYRDGVSQDAYRKYWAAVGNYYSEVDRLIGEWMNLLPSDTTVMIVSAYGFRWGKNRPYSAPNGRAALSDHRNPGIFIAYGNHVAPSRAAHGMALYDLAPTVLSILGLPQSSEMPGHVATWAFRDITPVETVKVVSYSEFVSGHPLTAAGGPRLQDYQTALQAVGHLSDPSRNLTPLDENGDQAQTADVPATIPPQQWGWYAYYNNLGVEMRKQNKLKDAAEAFQKAIELNPNRPVPYLNLAMVQLDRQMYTFADENFQEAVHRGLPNAERWYVDYAALYRQRDMASRAIAILYKGKAAFPQSPAIAQNLGSALVQAQRYTEGQPELERALGLQPSSTLALNNIGLLYAKKNDYGRALDFWNRSLAIDPTQRQIRAAAEAARTRL